MERIFRSSLNGVLMAHTEWLLGVQLRHFSTTCAVHIEDCGGWWLSSCHSSVAEHWLHKPGVLGSIPGGGLFTFLYFRLITSKFSFYFQHEARVLSSPVYSGLSLPDCSTPVFGVLYSPKFIFTVQWLYF